ncbi:MAG TPA: glycerol-3-phosphate dehydrogenase/oxidase [Tepidisphaeraceae bacterium]|jgi:glycerol-3-phosphate dehydrogenase
MKPGETRKLTEMATAPLDVLVIGGGIVGSGVARDAAMRGLRVALVDKSDFAFGTSSRSSRLLHGGLRYLAQGRVGLVHEASVEKMIIHRIAPHLAMPLPFIFPTRKGTEWKLWKLRIGVKIYDLLCGGRNLGKSSGMRRNAALQLLPQLSEDNLTGAVRYFDGMTNDARLVLDTLRSAAAAGALLANFTAVEKVERIDDHWQVTLHDRLSGQRQTLTTRCIVNAGGAWGSHFKPSQVKLRVTKGVHLVIDRSRLNVPEAVVMTDGSRILFVIPWGERIILGTTDTDYTGPLDTPDCQPADMKHILEVTNRTFPGAKITDGDVISSWSGLRPLIADPKGKPSDISRAHQIRMTEPGWFDVAGGKLTTYRLMAEQTVDQIVKHANLEADKCATAKVALLPEKTPPFSAILPPPISREAVEHYCKSEWAVNLDDVMIRRTSWHYYHRNARQIADEVSRWMLEIFGWDDSQRQQQLNRYDASAAACSDGEARTNFRGTSSAQQVGA